MATPTFMSSLASTSPLPSDCLSSLPSGDLNPYTTLMYLSPDIGDKYLLSRYIYIGTLGAFLWDILTHLPEEYHLLFKHRFSLPVTVYFTSRITALLYIITNVIFQTQPISSCQALEWVIGWCFCLAVSSSSFLFFLRIRAIFERKPRTVRWFFVLWLMVLGGTMTLPFAISGAHVGPTKYCINTSVKPFASTGIIISAINDLLVVSVISRSIIGSATTETSTRSAQFRSFLGLDSLPKLSKAIMRSGQQYYLITVTGNIITLIMILAPSIHPVYRAMFTVPNVALMNFMACRVFRKIKFGVVIAMSTNPSEEFHSITFSRSRGPSRVPSTQNTNVHSTVELETLPNEAKSTSGEEILDGHSSRNVQPGSSSNSHSPVTRLLSVPAMDPQGTE